MTFNLKRHLEKRAQAVPPTPPAPQFNPLDGKNNQSARNFVNKILSAHSKGFFSDEDWGEIHKIWNAMNAAGLDWNTTDNKYIKDPTRPMDMPISKEWRFEVRFTNNNQRPTILYGVATAHGAGSVEDPLGRYDITAYV